MLPNWLRAKLTRKRRSSKVRWWAEAASRHVTDGFFSLFFRKNRKSESERQHGPGDEANWFAENSPASHRRVATQAQIVKRLKASLNGRERTKCGLRGTSDSETWQLFKTFYLWNIPEQWTILGRACFRMSVLEGGSPLRNPLFVQKSFFRSLRPHYIPIFPLITHWWFN